MTDQRASLSVLVDLPNAEAVTGLAASLASIAQQSLPLPVAVMASPDLHQLVRTIRAPAGLEVSITDNRPRCVNGQHMLVMAAGGILREGALERIVEELTQNPRCELLYCDDLDSAENPVLRPGFSPQRLLYQQYMGELLVMSWELYGKARTSLYGRAVELGLSAPLSHASALVLADLAAQVIHIPEILYQSSPANQSVLIEDVNEQVAEVNRYLELSDYPGRAAVPSVASSKSSEQPQDWLELSPYLYDEPLVSLIMPTIGMTRDLGAGEISLVEQAIESIRSKSNYSNLELLLVLGRGSDPKLAQSLQRAAAGLRLQIVYDDRNFNFANASNLGAAHSRGDVLVFLNDDVKVIDPMWLDRLVMHATQPDVGAVGTRLLYQDGTIQHAGIWSRGGHPIHRYERYDASALGYRAALAVAQNAIAVTGACLAVETYKFEAVGGFCPDFPSSYNDVDLCLKLDNIGYGTVVVAETALFHYESSSRDPSIGSAEMERLHSRWRSKLNADPYDNPNHTAELSEELPLPVTLPTTRQPTRIWYSGAVKMQAEMKAV